MQLYISFHTAMDRVDRLPLILILILLYHPLAFSSIVTTPSGAIDGTTFHINGASVRAFLGIPYAKPPVGRLRFKRTVPVEPWGGVLRAKSFAPACVQYTIFPTSSAVHPPDLSEDCLYLNVFAPMDASQQNKKSVMFFVHGGAFIMSSSIIDRFHAQGLAAEGDVIVVSFNYRLGVQGFFYSGTEDAPGNMGMWDIAEALKWVHRNIGSFGGDRDSITVFGQSSGGVAAGMLAVSPVTRDLFKRVIMESGVPTILGGEDNNRDFDVSLKLAKKVGCVGWWEDSGKKTSIEIPKAVVECVKGKDPYKLAVLLSNITDGEKKGFYPRFGDAFLSEDPRQVILDGDFEAKEALIGTTSGDGAMLLNKAHTDVFGFFGEKDPQINRSFGESIIREKFEGRKNVNPDAVVEQYLGDLSESDYYRIRQQVFTAYGDFERICPSVYLAESFAKEGASVYYYVFTHRPLNSPYAPWMFAAHTAELQFVFGRPLRSPQDYSPEEVELSKRVIRAWSTFAKTGTPPGNWLQYSRLTPFYHVLDTEVSDINGIGPHKMNCDFFRSAFGVDEVSDTELEILEALKPLTYFDEEKFSFN